MHGAGSRQREAGARLANGRAVRWGCVLPLCMAGNWREGLGRQAGGRGRLTPDCRCRLDALCTATARK